MRVVKLYFELCVLQKADKALVVSFGLPAIIAAFVGATALGYVSHFEEIAQYSIGAKTTVITPIKLTMGLLMLVFALFELLHRLRELKFERNKAPYPDFSAGSPGTRARCARHFWQKEAYQHKSLWGPMPPLVSWWIWRESPPMFPCFCWQNRQVLLAPINGR